MPTSDIIPLCCCLNYDSDDLFNYYESINLANQRNHSSDKMLQVEFKKIYLLTQHHDNWYIKKEVVASATMTHQF